MQFKDYLSIYLSSLFVHVAQLVIAYYATCICVVVDKTCAFVNVAQMQFYFCANCTNIG